MSFGDQARILMYSHDTYGLGHLRRSLAIAKSVRSIPASVIIITGSPLVGRFAIPKGIDFVRIPGMIKVSNEEYTPLSIKLPPSNVLSIREEIILATIRSFRPHFFLVDKSPLGLKREIQSSLEWINANLTECTTILGLRDIMDSSEETIREWTEKNIYEAMKNLYKEIWVYGVRDFYDPIEEYQIPPSISKKLYFTGYIPRYVPSDEEIERVRKTFLKKIKPIKGNSQIPIVLITAGGGGDGYPIFDTFLKAFEEDKTASSNLYTILVTGPFVEPEVFLEIKNRASRFGWKTIKFYRHMETLIALATVVVSMGGYNTLCEILTLRKPALIVPRTIPREEQLIRAQVLCKHGFCEFIPPKHLTPKVFKEKLFQLFEKNVIDATKFERFPFTAFEIIKDRLLHHLSRKGLV
ncbi:MAG: glycosyltransferase [Syntrophobacterales bacterium]|nr:glycosyltransferase [Syntrophobacterales bacterium]